MAKIIYLQSENYEDKLNSTPPPSTTINNGDMIVNYLNGNEQLLLKNSSGKIVQLNEDSGFVSSNYYTKQEIDDKENTLQTDIDKKLDLSTWEEYISFKNKVNYCTSYTNMPIDGETIIMNSATKNEEFSFIEIPPVGRKIYIINLGTTKHTWDNYTDKTIYTLLRNQKDSREEPGLYLCISTGEKVYICYGFDGVGKSSINQW